MMKKLLIFSLLSFAIACSDETTEVDVQEFADQSLTEISIETRSGPTGCYVLVFPLTFEMPDGSLIEAESFEEAKEAFKSWKEENPDVTGRPHLSYPVEMINSEGDLITIADRAELQEVRKQCKKEFIQHAGKRCLRLVMPVSIVFPNDDVVEFENRKALKLALRLWKFQNPDADDRPSLQFPVDVYVVEDQEVVTVNSSEELQALKENCQ